MRALTRYVTWVVVAGLLAAQPAVWVAAHHAALEDDAACALRAPSVGPHHQDGHQLEEPNLPNPIEHCVFCHLQRAWGGATLGIPSVFAVPAPALAVALDRPGAVISAARVTHDLRGPPASI